MIRGDIVYAICGLLVIGVIFSLSLYMRSGFF